MRTMRAALRGFIVLGCAAFLLSGCVSLSEGECRGGDWQSIGFQDGVNGEDLSQLAEHRKACARYGVLVDLGAYELGRNAGLQTYCQPHNGFRVGRSGRGYAGVCPVDRETLFLAAYQEGYHLFELRSRVSEIERAMADRERDVRDADDRVHVASAQLNQDNLDPNLRARLIRELRYSAELRARLLSDLDQMRYDLGYHQRQLFDFEHQLRQQPLYRDWTDR